MARESLRRFWIRPVRRTSNLLDWARVTSLLEKREMLRLVLPCVLASAAALSAVAPTVAPPARVVLPTLPRVYVYDHCPFCVRVRLALGMKNIKSDLIFLANDDIETPTKLVGKKLAPIMQFEDGSAMMESLDIVELLDTNEKYGPTGFIKPASGRTDLKDWQKTVKEEMRILQRPRYMKAFLPEFAMKDAR